MMGDALGHGEYRRLDPSTTLRIREGVRAYIASQGLCDARSRVLLAVSGGRDSMVMLSIFRHIGQWPIAVAHCNFGLRGGESDADEAFVRSQCEEMRIPFFVQRFHTEGWAEEHRCSIQVAARTLRYEWFEELLLHHGFTCVATAHHAGDLAEGVLLHMARGAGLRGLAGMPVRNGHVIRPLLNTPSKDVALWAHQMRVVHREDSSNASDKYMRNYVRHHALPSLAKVNPQVESNIAHAAYTVQLAQAELRGLALELWGELDGFFPWYDACAQGRENLAGWWVGELLSAQGFGFAQIRNLVEALRSHRVGARIRAGERVAQVGRRGLYFHADNGERAFAPRTYALYEGDRVLGLELLDCVPPAGALPTMCSSRAVAYLDADRLCSPLTLRCWQAGDRFAPLGMNGRRKKVSDLLTDWRILPSDRDSVLVLLSGQEIVWVLGIRASQACSVGEHTRRVVRIALLDEAWLPSRELP